MSIKLNIYNQKAEQTGEIEVSEKIFGVKAKSALLHQAMVAQMANERQVLAHTKTKGEVRGGGKKPWKQKGTGRARAGSSRSPLWIGGGVTFGPTNERNFKKRINKKMKQNAIMMVLSDRTSNDNLVVLDKLEMEEYKTEIFNKMLKNLEEKVLCTLIDAKERRKNVKRSILVLNDKKDDKVKRSGRNLAGVEMSNLDNINVLDLLKYKSVIITVDGIKKIEERYKN